MNKRPELTAEEITKSDFASEEFAEYLKANGADVQPVTSQWELLRYKVENAGLLVVYHNAKGRVTAPPIVVEHFELFKAGKGLVRRDRPGKGVKRSLKRQIFKRDGNTCFLCGQFLDNDKTLEHLLPIDAGGTSNIKNLALAHKNCNTVLGNKSIAVKIQLRDEVRQQVNQVPPWEPFDPLTLDVGTYS